jgi:hypothetical protein
VFIKLAGEKFAEFSQTKIYPVKKPVLFPGKFSNKPGLRIFDILKRHYCLNQFTGACL